MNPRRHAKLGCAATARDDDPGIEIDKGIRMRGRICVVESKEDMQKRI